MGSLGEDPAEEESERFIVTNVLEAGEDLVEPYVLCYNLTYKSQAMDAAYSKGRSCSRS